MSLDEMLSLFQEVLQDVLGQLFKPHKVLLHVFSSVLNSVLI